MIKVSVIVPIYNAEKYLKQCLDSIQRQTLSDIEVIMIDDGSTDRSSEIGLHTGNTKLCKDGCECCKNGGKDRVEHPTFRL